MSFENKQWNHLIIGCTRAATSFEKKLKYVNFESWDESIKVRKPFDFKHFFQPSFSSKQLWSEWETISCQSDFDWHTLSKFDWYRSCSFDITSQ